jgi:branched-chain amino acid transport system ATP-binding protein
VGAEMTQDVLNVRNLGVRFGGLVALNGVSLRVPHGQIHGVIGPNGAGKSTLFNAISGLVPLSTGSVSLSGVDITQMPAHARASFGMKRTFQSLQLIKSMTVLENILIGLHLDGRESTSSLARQQGGSVGDTNASAVDRACEVAAQLGLAEHLYKTVDLLSFRDQRFVEIGRAMVSEPQLIMLDEPAAGLAAPEVDELRDLLIRMQAKMGFAILLVEHVISLVMQVCHRVTVLEYGTVIASGTGKEVMADSNVIRAYLGEDIDA